MTSDALFGSPYKVLTHEHLDDEWATVTIRCIGVPTKGIQPVAWPFALKVPKAELDKFPLGGHVRRGRRCLQPQSGGRKLSAAKVRV